MATSRKRSRKGIGGRPRRDPSEVSESVLYARMTTAEYDQLRQAAVRTGAKSATEFARKAALDAARKALGIADL